MKKILIFLLLLATAVGATAQIVTKGDMPSLRGEHKIRVVFDYSEQTISQMTIGDWLEFRQNEQPQYNAEYELENELKPSLEEAFIEAVNDKLRRVFARLVVNEETNYTLIVIPLNVQRKGNNDTYCTLTDNKGNEIVSFTTSGRGGTFGTMANLWGDGFKSVGKKVGALLAPCFK